MKTRKTIALQFDLMSDIPFNLAGEVQSVPAPIAPAQTKDATGFFNVPSVHEMVEKSTGKTIQIFHAKNPTEAKYACARIHGGKPCDYLWDHQA